MFVIPGPAEWMATCRRLVEGLSPFVTLEEGVAEMAAAMEARVMRVRAAVDGGLLAGEAGIVIQTAAWVTPMRRAVGTADATVPPPVPMANLADSYNEVLEGLRREDVLKAGVRLASNSTVPPGTDARGAFIAMTAGAAWIANAKVPAMWIEMAALRAVRGGGGIRASADWNASAPHCGLGGYPE
jgi:hypothetical protein